MYNFKLIYISKHLQNHSITHTHTHTILNKQTYNIQIQIQWNIKSNQTYIKYTHSNLQNYKSTKQTQALQSCVQFQINLQINATNTNITNSCTTSN